MHRHNGRESHDLMEAATMGRAPSIRWSAVARAIELETSYRENAMACYLAKREQPSREQWLEWS